MGEHTQKLIMQRKDDPAWPKCRMCREPLAADMVDTPTGKAGFCHDCEDARNSCNYADINTPLVEFDVWGFLMGEGNYD